MRGFPTATVTGTRAVAGSLEYRAPLKLGGIGFGALPAFFDRSSVTAFVDAAQVSCSDALLNVGVCSNPAVLDRTIASAGGELLLSAAVFDWDVPQRFRFGFAVPFSSRDLASHSVSFYMAYGLSF